MLQVSVHIEICWLTNQHIEWFGSSPRSSYDSYHPIILRQCWRHSEFRNLVVYVVVKTLVAVTEKHGAWAITTSSPGEPFSTLS